ncbi:hypothetical protein P7C73_g3003, partial [Tremellales sp. Uapishka_1]
MSDKAGSGENGEIHVHRPEDQVLDLAAILEVGPLEGVINEDADVVGHDEDGIADEKTDESAVVSATAEEAPGDDNGDEEGEGEGNGDDKADEGMGDLDGEEENTFDPATLANLAALARITNNGADQEDVTIDGQQEADQEPDQNEDFSQLIAGQSNSTLTREQVQEFVNNLGNGGLGRDAEGDEDAEGEPDTETPGEGAETREAREEKEEREEELRDIREQSGEDDGYGSDDRYEGRSKRRRNRTVLSCTGMSDAFTIEAAINSFLFAMIRMSQEVVSLVPPRVMLSSIIRPLAQNNVIGIFLAVVGEPAVRSRQMGFALTVPSIKRGVPSMCRMEIPVLPQRKKRRRDDDIPINYELGLRVQALEALIRSGSNMDTEQASAAALETILHATRAANSGQQDAANALAQLTASASLGLGIGGMSSDAQGSLLLDVLNQLSAASNGRSSIQPSTDPTNHAEMKETWSSVPAALPETSVQVEQAYQQDEITTKLNISLQGFREDDERIFVPPTVRYAEKNLLRNENILAKEALPIHGYAPFIEAGIKFAYGADSVALREKRISAIQAISITGALRLAAVFLSRFPTSSTGKICYIPSPMMEDDTVAIREAGLEPRTFRFFDRKSGGVDWEGLREDLQAAVPKSVVLLQVSGSTPTGAELSAGQWRLLTTIIQERQLIPLFLMSFQGLSSGDTNRDAQPLRFMVHEGLPVVLCQSFDAMMGLYADSPAIVSVVTQNTEDRDRIDSQLRAIARSMYYHPSPWGAYVAYALLSDQKLYPAWLAEIKAMADRLRSVREKLYDIIANKLKTPGTWFHFKRATGMYCSTMLPPSQVSALTTQRHVHLLPDGCFSLGCLNANKIDTLARAIDYVVREGIREQEEQEEQSRVMAMALAAANEQQAREEAEAAAAAEAEEADAARMEDTLLMDKAIQSAIEAQRRAEEEEEQREEEVRRDEEVERRRIEREKVARQAEAILAMI